MVTIEVMVDTSSDVAVKPSDIKISKSDLIGKAFELSISALSDIVPEFEQMTFHITQDSLSDAALSDNLLWREKKGTYEVYDLSPTKKSKDNYLLSVKYYLYDPNSSNKEKILVSLN